MNKEFYNKLPGCICACLDNICLKYSDKPWFEEAWDRYAYHVESSDMDTLRSPGYIFNRYINKSALEHNDDIMDNGYVKNILEHSGTKGMKKGVNKYRNPDGTLNEEGKRRYYGDKNPKTKDASKENPQITTIKVKPPKDWVDKNKDKKINNELVVENRKRIDGTELREFVDYVNIRQNLKETSQLMNETNKLVNNVQKLVPNDSGNKIYSSHPEFTDSELQNKINRLKNEHTYSDLVGETKYVKSGSEKTREIIQTVGSSIAIIGSGAMVAATIVDLLGKHKKPKKSE